MSKGHEENEFIAVRVQDPRIQNEGSWNSYVDYKIFLHTNSKAFTAKTSCVRRRYSEFVWLKKKLQKNCGLVPVPDLPGRSFFYFSNEDFLERRRTGLQIFLDNVLHMTVCLSDSQLHLFLQTQLPVGHIQDCVQGHTPYTVTDAILTYASSNVGWVQAQEEDLNQEPSLTPVPYESMESPAPHLPTVPNKEASNSAAPLSDNAETLKTIVEVHDTNTEEVEFSNPENPSLKVLQKDNHLEAVLERHSPAEATFFLGDGQDEPASDRSSLEEQIHPGCYQIQTPVQVHPPVGTGIEDECDALQEKVIDQNGAFREERGTFLDTAIEIHKVPSTRNITHLGTEKENGQGDNIEKVAMVNASDELETEEQVPEHITECVNISEEGILGRPISEEALERDVSLEGNGAESVGSADNVLEHVSSDEPLLEHNAISETIQEYVSLEKEVLEQVTTEEHILECNGSLAEHILKSISSEELDPECPAISEEAVQHVNLEEEVPEHVGREEQVQENVNSHEQQLLKCDWSEELVLEHHAISEEVVDHVSLEEEVVERVSSEQQDVEHVDHHEEQLLEDVGSEELVSECFSEEVKTLVSPEKEVSERLDSEEMILDHARGEEEPLSECLSSEELVPEHNATSEEVVDHVSLEEEVSEQIDSEEHNVELVKGHDVQHLENDSSVEGVLEQHVSSIEEVPEQHVSSVEEVPEQQVSSVEEVPEQHVSSVEEVPEQQVSSVEEVPEQQVSSVEKVPEQQVSSVEEVLEQHVSSTEEILEQHVSSEQKIVEQCISSTEKVVEQHVSVEKVPKLSASSEEVLEQDISSKEEVVEHHISSGETVLEQNDCCEQEVLEQHVGSEEKDLEQPHFSEENVLEQYDGSEEAVVEHDGLGQDFDSFRNEEKIPSNVSSDVSEEHVHGEIQGSGVEMDPHDKHSDNLEHADTMELKTEIDQEEQKTVVTAVGVECDEDATNRGTRLDQDCIDQEVVVVETNDKEDSDDNESTDAEEEAMNGYMEITCKGENHNTDILSPQMDKCCTQADSNCEVNDTKEEMGRIEPTEEVEIPYMTNNSSSANTPGFSGSVSSRDMTASRELVVEENNSVGNLAGGHTSESVTLSVEASEQNCEKDVQGFTAEVGQTDINGMAGP